MVDRIRGRLCLAYDVFPGHIVATHSRHRNLGRQHSGGMGIRDCEFRLVGGNRARWHVHLRDFAFAFPAVAHGHQPFHGGDDSVCRVLRRSDAVASSRAAMGFLLATAISRHDAPLAAIPQSAGVGRFCSRYLFHDLIVVLVSRPGSRFGDSPRSRKKTLAKKSVCLLRVRLA